MQKPSAILLGAAIAWIAWAHAAAEPVTPADTGTPALQAVPEPPEIPPRVQSGEKLEPEVSVRRDGQKTVTEYRLNGRLQSIKVQPVAGPTYWLVDTTGDGFTDTRYDNYNPPFAIPGWTILRW